MRSLPVGRLLRPLRRQVKKWMAEGPERERQRSANFWRGRGGEEDGSDGEDLPRRAPSPDANDEGSIDIEG